MQFIFELHFFIEIISLRQKSILLLVDIAINNLCKNINYFLLNLGPNRFCFNIFTKRYCSDLF